MNTVNTELQNINTNDIPEEPLQKVLLRSVLTSDQVREVESRQKQPTVVLTQVHGNVSGYHALGDSVHPMTKAMLDEKERLILVAPVAGG